MYPRSKHWHLCVLERQRDQSSVHKHTRVMPSAECHNNHRLVCCKLKPHFKPKSAKKTGTANNKKIKTSDLQINEVKVNFQAGLQAKLDKSNRPSDPSSEILWEQLKTAILQPTAEILGFTKKKDKDWFDENDVLIQKLLKKRSVHQAHLAQPTCLEKKAAFGQACSLLQRKLREVQIEWWTSLARRTQLCADSGDYRGFYEALKAVYGPAHQVRSPLGSSDGLALLTDTASILNRWSEYFQALFSAN
ncbi:Hypothetical predicted protein [Octopus vulgaris]|uniref:Uncharacterized protein n=1 Tax=Octopus vulgaris TaxID=6645 RepID=A0AA36F5X8_OCTVU|nr:Hypothetical predicted protein [Octopus vulgaris]